MRGFNNVINGVNHPYGFGGKEENDEFGLEWHDFHARNYDASIGRWFNIDPLAELMTRHSPYNYAFNNPIFFIDPSGMIPEEFNNEPPSNQEIMRDIDGPQYITDWYRDDTGNIVYDEDITSQQDLDDAGIDGEYIAPSFVGEDQNGIIYNFNLDGSISESQATIPMLQAAGIDTSSIISVTSKVSDDGIKIQHATADPVIASVLTFMTTDRAVPDASDAYVPKWIAYAIMTAAALKLTDDLFTTLEFAAEHTKRKGSKKRTNDKHTKKRPGAPGQKKKLPRKRGKKWKQQ